MLRLSSVFSNKINYRNHPEGKHHRTPVHQVVKHHNREGLRLAIEDQTANLNARDSNGETPLHLAILIDSTEALTLLLAANETRQTANTLDINAQNNNGETPLHKAVLERNVLACELLLQNNANVNLATPAQPAAKKNPFFSSLSSISSSISEPSPDHPYSSTPLHYAFHEIEKNKGHQDDPLAIIKLLIDHSSINIDAQDQHGNTPIHLAMRTSIKNFFTSEAFSSLLNKKLNWTLKNNQQKTILHLAASNKHMPPEKFNLLVNGPHFDRKCIDAIDEVGKTALMHAIQNNNIDQAITLIELGADILKTDRNLKTVFLYAVESQRLALVQLLFDKNITFNAAEGKLALKQTLENDNPALALLLINNGVAPDAQVDKKTPTCVPLDTALHYAIRIGDTELAEACLGTKSMQKLLTIKNSKNMQAMHVAIKMVNQHMANSLFGYGAKEEALTSNKNRSWQGMGDKVFLSGEDLKNFIEDQDYHLTDEQLIQQNKAKQRYQHQTTLHAQNSAGFFAIPNNTDDNVNAQERESTYSASVCHL